MDITAPLSRLTLPARQKKAFARCLPMRVGGETILFLRRPPSILQPAPFRVALLATPLPVPRVRPLFPPIFRTQLEIRQPAYTVRCRHMTVTGAVR